LFIDATYLDLRSHVMKGNEMAGWYAARSMRWSTKLVIAAALLAVLLVAAVPVALFIGVLLMLLGHVVGGLALFGASILAAVAAVVIASLSGVRHLRKLVTERGFQAVRLGRSEYYYE
jgi:uncharacterized membrane protein YdjX (TVP38/TMEM64 family)